MFIQNSNLELLKFIFRHNSDKIFSDVSFNQAEVKVS